MSKTTNKGLYDLMKRIYNPKYNSVWTCSFGRNQSGKTDWNLRQLEMINELGLAGGIGTNMETVECKDFEIELIKDFKTLKARCKMLNPDPKKRGLKRFFFLVSELADFVPKDTPWTNVKFIKELQKVRKYGLSIIGDAIDRVDGRVFNENHFHGYFVKYDKGNPRVAKYFDWISGDVLDVEDIPRTTIEFDTYESASFYMEPQADYEGEIPLNQDHLIVKKYLEAGCSIVKTGLHQQEVKRARDNVLKYYWKHHLEPQPEAPKDIAIVEPSIIEES